MVEISDIFKILDPIANKDGAYRTNKRRAAVVAHDGFSLADFFRDNRVNIHVGSLVLSGVFGGIGWLRRERGAEALALWFGLSAVCGAVGWYTRDSQDGDVRMVDKVTSYLDYRADMLDRAEPGWDQKAIDRVLG